MVDLGCKETGEAASETTTQNRKDMNGTIMIILEAIVSR